MLSCGSITQAKYSFAREYYKHSFSLHYKYIEKIIITVVAS